MSELTLKPAQRTVSVAAIALALVLVDQFTKWLALENLEPGRIVPVVGDLLAWRLTFNDSAGFSLGFGVTWFFTLLSTAAFLILILRAHKVHNTLWLILAGVIGGGIVGNLVDRLTREPGFANGQVVDFIQIPFNFPIFNFADICISVGMTLVAWRIMSGDKLG
ncbi:MAG: signal peptidase II, partial [Actinobacteria bacterium]|nr:signal peptidase II [Actinomycetota bacterium]